MESRICWLQFEFTSHIHTLKHLRLNCFRNGGTCQDYLKLWNAIDWITIAFGFTAVCLGKQDSFESWRPAPQPCDQEPHFSDFCDQLRQFCSGGSIWFRFKGIGEFGQHTGCSDACCYFIVGYFFNYKLIAEFDLPSCSRLFSLPRIVHHFAIESGRSFWMVFVLKVSGELPQTLAGLPSDALDFAVLTNRSYLTAEAVKGISTCGMIGVTYDKSSRQ